MKKKTPYFIHARRAFQKPLSSVAARLCALAPLIFSRNSPRLFSPTRMPELSNTFFSRRLFIQIPGFLKILFSENSKTPSARTPFRAKILSSSGFTLIELLVVIAIIGILTGLVGSNFIRSRVRARDAERRSNLKDIQTALEMYLNDNGRYPCRTIASSTGNARIQNFEWGNDSFTNTSNGHPETIYMAVLPGDPSGPGAQYHYEVNDTFTKYRVYAWLENEEDIERVEGGYFNKMCSETNDDEEYFCNYGVSSTNTTMDENWVSAGNCS